MKILHRTPGHGLIFDLAYHNDSFLSKLLLMLLGGIGTFLSNIFRGHLAEALFGPSSHLYSVMATAVAKQKKIHHNLFLKTAWILLGFASGLQAVFFGFLAGVGTLCFGLARNDADYDVIAAQLLALGLPLMASDIVKLGQQRFPESMFLKRRKVYCFMKTYGAGFSLFLAIEDLERCFREDLTPELKLRIARTLIEAQQFLSDHDKVKKWLLIAQHIPGWEKIKDQVVKMPVQ